MYPTVDDQRDRVSVLDVELAGAVVPHCRLKFVPRVGSGSTVTAKEPNWVALKLK
jgi:hypothetical protein